MTKFSTRGISTLVGIIIILIVILGVGGILVWQLPKLPKEEVVPQEDETADWKTYRNEEYGFEIKYPEDVIKLTERNEGIALSHSISFEHPDPCDFKGDAPVRKELTDFGIGIGVINKNLRETIIARESDSFVSGFLLDNKLKIEPGFIDGFNLGSLKGYRITSGMEGCGNYTYYIPLDSKNTLLVTRGFITELSPIISDYQKYLQLPGIITPEKEEKLFNQILSTFRFLE